MLIEHTLKMIIPESLKSIFRPIRNTFVNKSFAEMSFWRS